MASQEKDMAEATFVMNEKHKKLVWLGLAVIVGILVYFVLNWIFTFVLIIGIAVIISLGFYKHRKKISGIFKKR